MFSGGIEMEHWLKMGYIARNVEIKKNVTN